MSSGQPVTGPVAEPSARDISALLARLLEHLRATTDANTMLEIARDVHRAALAENAPHVVAEALLVSGQAHLKLGNLEEALSVLRGARTQASALESIDFELDALTSIGHVYRNLGEFDAAALHLQQVLERDAVESTVRAKALNIYAGVQHARGDSVGALESLKQALVVHREHHNHLDQAICLINSGVLYTDQGDYPQALESLLEARGLLRDQVSNPRQEGNCLINLGRVYESMREYEKAIDIYTETLALARRNADRLIEAMASVNLGAAQALLEHHDEAMPLFQRALEIARDIGLRQVEIAALDGIGTVRLAFGNLEEALESHREALRLARETGYREQEIESLVNLARVHLASKNPDLALELLLEALPFAERAELQKFVVDIHALLAETQEARGDFRAALHHHREYHRSERSMFSFEAERRAKHLKMTFELERARGETEVIRRANERLEENVFVRTKELEEARVEVVMRLAVAAEYRDDTTGQHTSRVGILAARIAERLGLPAEEIELLRLAARLHDVGKIGISDLLMLKPDKLTPLEFERIKDHTTIGAQILSGGQSPLLQLAEVVALTHHERWDGHGYPHGLSGEEIPLEGRIVAVADVYDALLSDRPYKKAWFEPEARAEIQAQSGAQFDPRVVQAFLDILKEDDAK
jgi:HD-GYP domain-containing protein (c-di-GMP phosphodiesterase class II)/Tfp pilus assembly protein PilF